VALGTVMFAVMEAVVNAERVTLAGFREQVAPVDAEVQVSVTGMDVLVESATNNGTLAVPVLAGARKVGFVDPPGNSIASGPRILTEKLCDVGA